MNERYEQPYVVSGDIEPLLQQWGKSRGIQIPKQEFFQELEEDFSAKMRGLFPFYEYVPAERLLYGLNTMYNDARKDGLTAISLDPTFRPTQYNIGVSRAVDQNLKDAGLMPRAGFPDLDTQYDQLQAAGIKYAALFDDVVFSGGVIMDVRDQLKSRGIETVRVCAGIAVSEGMGKVVEQGIEFSTEYAYLNGVIDEVCERDFYPGVPFSGRSLASYNGVCSGDYGLPYINPYGIPEKWASIPNDQTRDFSLFCLEQTAKLYEEIGKVTGRKIVGADLDRKFGNAFREKSLLGLGVSDVLMNTIEMVRQDGR